MARSRNVKPGFFVNDELGELRPEIRLLAIGMPCIADRDGRLEDRPRKIRVQLVPYDEIDVDDALNQLQAVGFIQRYSVDNNKYIQIVNFAKHQNPHKNEAPSSIPAPEQHHTSTVQAAEQHSSNRADSLLLVTDSFQKNTSEPAAPACPHLEIISAYHEVLPERPQVIPARWRGSVSERNLQARWRENAEHRTVDFWRDLFGAVRTNDWWMRGDERGTWKGVDLHWLLKRTNFDKAVQHWANLP